MKKVTYIGISLGLVLFSCSNENTKSEIKFSTQSSGSVASEKVTYSAVSTGSLIPISNMHAPRAAHTATLLQDGTVLICGGFAGNSNNSLSSVEIFNPISKSFENINSLTTPRVSHSATLLPNGKVLIAGGYNGNALSSTEIYDPETKLFTKGPNLNIARYGHTATVLNNGKILLSGGVGSGWTFLSSVELYDINANKFILTSPMADARESHTATLLKNGNVLITGGHRDRRENIKLYTSSEIYDSKRNQFSAAGKLNIPRHKHDAVLLSDGKVLINGGADRNDSPFTSAEIFDPQTAKFTSISNMNFPRYKHNETSVLLPNNNILIGGGSDQAEIFDFETRKFIPVKGNMGTRLFSSATLLNNGEVLITGGYDEKIKASKGAQLYVHRSR
ncbi:MAG TPA: kelch repeat-containing protein [Anditalea sp.]|nr:kelch repeat-containing protein [Anditalea sp.]